uniref:Uncharacterized protein n=2 Tax=Bombyx mori TaxID=7091 RepID=A0A8R2RB19_BOMMO|nr:uncharacterized protein LOC101742037 isoform X1 [Bombyx mori]
MLQSAILVVALTTIVGSDPSPGLVFDYPNVKDEIYEQPVNLMNPKKVPHAKDDPLEATKANDETWPTFDFSKFESYLNNDGDQGSNRIKRKAKRRRGKSRRRMKYNSTPSDEFESGNTTTSRSPKARRSRDDDSSMRQSKNKKIKNKKHRPTYETYDPPVKQWESGFVEMPKDLYQAHLRPGVIFRIHMAEAILKMQYRNYGEDKDESVIEADVEYLRLTRKVINDEITKFEDLKWLIGWFNNRSELIQEHMCNTRYYAVGIPPTLFTHPEEYMKRMCLFDNVYIDHIPYVVGEDSSLMAAVAPPVLHCDAATCTSVPFIDSIMFEERLSRTNVRTVTRCQSSCRAHCRNDADCLKRCADRCLRAD